MSDAMDTLAGLVTERFGDRLARVSATPGELTFEVAAAELLAVCRELRDEPALAFEVLADLSGIDYLHFGLEEWQTERATGTGFSRGVRRGADEILAEGEVAPLPERRFAVAYHLLSITHNRRLRLRAFCERGEPPMLPSVTTVWAGANWFEREVFDLFGVLFHGHPDLRRLLTDYGFIGHPFRKDFPLSGHVEVRYDPERQRVVYQPVSIEPRTLVPRVIRGADHRYDPQLTAAPVAGKPNA